MPNARAAKGRKLELEKPRVPDGRRQKAEVEILPISQHLLKG
ncbi:hypothetical protein [Microcoleus vaginatus]